MTHTNRSPMIIGLAALATSCAAATTVWSAAIARADDLTEIVNAVSGDYGFGQTAFSAAIADFNSADFVAGYSALFSGLDDDLLSAPDNLLTGTVEALTNESVSGAFSWGLGGVPNLTTGLTDAQQIFTDGLGEFQSAATALAGGDYGTATLDNLVGLEFVSVLPVEFLTAGLLSSI